VGYFRLDQVQGIERVGRQHRQRGQAHLGLDDPQPDLPARRHDDLTLGCRQLAPAPAAGVEVDVRALALGAALADKQRPEALVGREPQGPGRFTSVGPSRPWGLSLRAGFGHRQSSSARNAAGGSPGPSSAFTGPEERRPRLGWFYNRQGFYLQRPGVSIMAEEPENQVEPFPAPGPLIASSPA